jgi:urease accessory protein
LLLLRASYFGQDTKELAVALASSQSRRKETEDQGFAFAHNINKIYGIYVDPAPLPVVVGQISKRLNLDIDRVSSAYLHSIISNWISIGIRLVPIGQTDGQIILHSLFPVMEQLVQRSKQADLDQLTSCGLLSEICALRHHSAKTRICIT